MTAAATVSWPLERVSAPFAGRTRRREDMALTAELVALCNRLEPDPGRDPQDLPLTGAEFEAIAQQLDEEIRGGPLWLFAYGSLIWKPVFDFVEERRGTAFGWHRSFCLELTRWRGSADQPGLMMALERGGRCDGVAYRLPDDHRVQQIERLLRREVDTAEHMHAVRWLPLQTPHGPVRALSFWAGPKGEGVARRLPLDRVARTIARACGHGGSGADYLYQTVLHLAEHGIRDRNLWRLQELVAGEIKHIHGL